MINIEIKTVSALVTFIVAFMIGIVTGFVARPYIMEIFNKELLSENETLKNQIVELKQQLLNQEITLSNCQKINSTIQCKFLTSKANDYITIYPYASVLKSQNNIVGYADTVEATDAEVSVIKTEKGEISSWKLLTVPFTVNFKMPKDVEMVNASVELFIKFDSETATTMIFAPMKIDSI